MNVIHSMEYFKGYDYTTQTTKKNSVLASKQLVREH